MIHKQLHLLFFQLPDKMIITKEPSWSSSLPSAAPRTVSWSLVWFIDGIAWLIVSACTWGISAWNSFGKTWKVSIDFLLFSSSFQGNLGVTGYDQYCNRGRDREGVIDKMTKLGLSRTRAKIRNSDLVSFHQQAYRFRFKVPPIHELIDEWWLILVLLFFQNPLTYIDQILQRVIVHWFAANLLMQSTSSPSRLRDEERFFCICELARLASNSDRRIRASKNHNLEKKIFVLFDLHLEVVPSFWLLQQSPCLQSQ